MNIQDNTNIPNISGIYKITNSINNKCYIGMSTKLKDRIKRHLRKLVTNNHNNKYLSRAFNKYGVDNFEIEILEMFNEITHSELLKLEIEYIQYYNSLKNGYNLLLDNSSHLKKLNKSKDHIERNRKSQSKAVISFNRFTGEIFEEFSSITNASVFFKTSSSNISRVCKGKLNYIKDHVFCYKEDYDPTKDYSKPHYWSKGTVKSEETRALMTAIIQKRVGIDIYKYDLEWEFIEKYPSRANAEKMNNLKKESLRSKADIKTPFEGYFWMYNEI